MDADRGIFARTMGADFDRLHPQLQRRFGLSSAAGMGCVGRGVMDEVRRGPAWTVPFLRFGAWRHILMPIRGRDIPFTIENYPYVDSLGRETISFVRTFEPADGRRARFDATMVRHETRDVVIDYLGTHQHLATDLDVSAEPDGSLLIRSGEQRFYEGSLAFGVPEVLTGRAQVRESYDDGAERFTIDVQVVNPRFGLLFGYRGSFACTWVDLAEHGVPPSVKPLREERRS